MTKVILFDVGGVLLPSPMNLWKNFEVENNLIAESITKTILSDEICGLFYSLERGEISLPDFENLFTYFYGKKYNRDQTSILPIFSFLFNKNGSQSNYANAHIDKRWITAINALRSAGIRVCIATNNFYSNRARYGHTLPKAIYELTVDMIFESCRLGMRKPEPRFYQHILDALNCDGESILFIDDLSSNLKVASELGFKTVKHDEHSIEKSISSIEQFVGFSVKNFVAGTRSLMAGEQLDEERLLDYTTQRFPHAVKDGGHQLCVRKFKHGQSNPTYYVSCCDCVNFVLRKKPSGPLLPSAHQIDREYRVQSAIKDVVPVVNLFDYVTGVLDTPFYTMEYCRGRFLTDFSLPNLQAAERKQIFDGLCDTLIKLRKVDVEKVGLSNFGVKGNYMKRSLHRFIRQYENSQQLVHPRVGDLIRWLQSNIPEISDAPPCIVHGDFKLDNVIFAEDEWRVVAVLDWELSTLGDPLVDLASCLIWYYVPYNFPVFARGFKGKKLPDGIPPLTEFLHRYFSQLCVNCPDCRYEEAANLTANGDLPDWWNFYIIFMAFRNAVVLIGILSRLAKGQASNPTIAATIQKIPAILMNLALDIIDTINSKKIGPSIKESSPLTPNEMSANARSMYERVSEFITEKILPVEKQLWARANGPEKWTIDPKIEQLKAEARSQGLWNLFITRNLDPGNEFGGAGLSMLEYAHICELMGQSMFAPEVFNCSAPDTGNMEVLIKYGTPAQRQKYLQPLLDGHWRSCFAMTEPDVASSDATNIQGTIVRDGNKFVLNARKWFTSGAMHPNCKVCIFMGRVPKDNQSQGSNPRHKKQTMILVDFDAPGIKVVRSIDVLGVYDAPGGHAEVLFENVLAPIENLLLDEGRGFEIAQGRLGPGRIHHCMRLIGQAERALSLMKKRVSHRAVHGKPLKDFQNVRLEVARSRMEIEQARLLVLKTAHEIDVYGAKMAAADIATIKAVVPQMCGGVVDRAMQHFGAASVSSMDTPLAGFHAAARALRFADGPDIVHEETVARAEFGRSHI